MDDHSGSDRLVSENVIRIRRTNTEGDDDSDGIIQKPDPMGRDDFPKQMYVQDACHSLTGIIYRSGSSLLKRSESCDRNMEEDNTDNDAPSAAVQLMQEMVNTNTSNKVPFITNASISYSNVDDVSPRKQNKERAEQTDVLQHDRVQADNNNNSGYTHKDDLTKDRKISSSQLTEQDVLQKLQDAAVDQQFQVLNNIKEISQSNLSMLSRLNKADPPVKRILAKPRLTAKEVKEIYIDADIEATVNEFLQTNLVGNFVMVRVLQENYLSFYSWLTAHLQAERNAWVARLKQALEKLEEDRKDCLMMKDALATSTTRLHNLIETCTSAVMETSGTDIADESSSLSRTLLSTSVGVFPCGEFGSSQAEHEQAAADLNSTTHQTHQQDCKSIHDELNELSRDSSDHSDVTSNVTSTSAPYLCPTTGDSYTQRCGEDLSRRRAHSVSCCCAIQSPASINKKNATVPHLEYTYDDKKCANVGRVLASPTKGDTETHDKDEVDLKQALRDKVHVLEQMCVRLVADYLVCHRLLCSSQCQSLQVKCHSGHGRLRDVETRVESLETENRQLVKEAKYMYSSLTQKTNEVVNLRGQVERLKGELRGVDGRVPAASEHLVTNCLVINNREIESSQLISRQRNIYSINRHQRRNNQFNRRYNDYTSNLHNFCDGLTVVSNKSKMSRARPEKNSQATSVELPMAQNGGDSSFTTTQTHSWPSSGKTLAEVNKQRQSRIKLKTSEDSIYDGMKVAAGTDLTDRRESRSKSLVEARFVTVQQPCINHTKKLIDTGPNHHIRFDHLPNSKSTANHWIGDTTGHAHLIPQASKTEPDGSPGSCCQEQKQRPTTAPRCMPSNGIRNPCNSPETIESVNDTESMLNSDYKHNRISNIGVGRKRDNNADSTDEHGFMNYGRNEVRKNNSTGSIESKTVTERPLAPSDEQKLSNSKDASRQKNAFRRADTDITERRQYNSKLVPHSDLGATSQSMPVLVHPHRDRK